MAVSADAELLMPLEHNDKEIWAICLSCKKGCITGEWLSQKG